MPLEGPESGEASAGRRLSRPVPPEALVGATFEQSPVGVAILDREQRFVMANASLSAIDGLPSEAHAGRLVTECIRTDRDLAADLARVLATGVPLVNALARTLPDGEEPARVLEISCYRLADHDGDVLGIGAYVADVTSARPRWRPSRRRSSGCGSSTRRAPASDRRWMSAGPPRSSCGSRSPGSPTSRRSTSSARCSTAPGRPIR